MKRFFLLLLALMAPLLARADVARFDMDAFAQMPVLQDGRIKPLDSLARMMLTRIHGSAGYEHLSATQWLAFMFFRPADAMDERMFRIESPQAASLLGLSVHSDHFYSFREIAAALPERAPAIGALSQKEKNALSGDETEVVRVYNAANDFAELMGTFSLLLPLDGVDNALRARLALPAGAAVTCLELMKNRQALESALQEVVKRKGSDRASYAPEERSLDRAVARLSLQEALDGQNALVRIIPPVWSSDEWLSPWAVFKSSSGSPQSAALLRDWRLLAAAYRAGDAQGWNAISARLRSQSLSAAPPSAEWRIFLEYTYNRLNLLPLAAALYAMGIALLGLGDRLRLAPLAGRMILAAGLACHALGLGMRMLILLRPPVSTLYESLIFVSFVVMAASLWMGQRKHRLPVLLAGASSALLLLLASRVFAGDGDTLGVLVAVLNTNFWLATHVVCITTGYGCALVTGVIAHLYLFKAAVRKTATDDLAPLLSLLYRASLLALCFTLIGTMLGGIWADQSWGRFWGWDPKENGALLIVLWLVWLLHGRVAGQLSAFAFAWLMALINVVVAVAWVGVNLLSVGLHSYGFTDVAADGLLAFCALEFTYVIAMQIARFSGPGERSAADRLPAAQPGTS
jgi:ABC-type transport system involved in cytochrome c biogenesis permease subunit